MNAPLRQYQIDSSCTSVSIDYVYQSIVPEAQLLCHELEALRMMASSNMLEAMHGLVSMPEFWCFEA